MGGGILPYSKHDGKIYFLFGRETKRSKYKDSGLYSDFGGSKEHSETQRQTALREGYEETLGLLGNKKKLNELIKKTNRKVVTDEYTTFLIEIPYMPMITEIYKNMFEFSKEHFSDIVEKRNGFFEKDSFDYFTVPQLNGSFKKFRPWYRKILKHVLEISKGI